MAVMLHLAHLGLALSPLQAFCNGTFFQVHETPLEALSVHLFQAARMPT